VWSRRWSWLSPGCISCSRRCWTGSAAFGKSNVLPGVVNWASAIGWVAFNNVFGALGVLAMIAIYLATLAADIVNDYTGSLSLQAAGSPSAGRRLR
jgi:purine-cytosine permease-like protein